MSDWCYHTTGLKAQLYPEPCTRFFLPAGLKPDKAPWEDSAACCSLYLLAVFLINCDRKANWEETCANQQIS